MDLHVCIVTPSIFVGGYQCLE